MWEAIASAFGLLTLCCSFHSRLCVRGDTGFLWYDHIIRCFYSRLCVRGDHVIEVSAHKGVVSIPASAWEAIRFLRREVCLWWSFYSRLCVRGDTCGEWIVTALVVSIPASAWEAIAKIYKIYCKIKLSNGSNVWVHEMNHKILNRFVVMYYQIVYFCLRQCSANICIGSIGAQDFSYFSRWTTRRLLDGCSIQ